MGHAHRVRAGALVVGRAIRIGFSGATAGALNALILSSTANDFPFIRDRFSDVGGGGTFILVVNLVAIDRVRDVVPVEVEGRFPLIVDFREGARLFLQVAVTRGSVTGPLLDYVAMIRSVADVSLFCVVAFGQCHLVSILLRAAATDTDASKANANSNTLCIYSPLSFDGIAGQI